MNIDEQLLLNKKIDENRKEKIVSQVLRIAVYNQFETYETYSAIIEKFGFLQPFVELKEVEARNYMLLIPLLEKYEVEVPINDWTNKIEIPKSYLEACEISVAKEIENISMYDNLISYTTEYDIKDSLYKLQANSFNNHLPTLRQTILNNYTLENSSEFGLNQEQIVQSIEEYQELFQELMAGDIDQNKLTKIFSKLNVSMISGMVFGGAAIAFLNNYINNKEN